MKPIVQTLIDLCDSEILTVDSSRDFKYKGYVVSSVPNGYDFDTGEKRSFIEFWRNNPKGSHFHYNEYVTEGEATLLKEALDNRFNKYKETLKEFAKTELGL